MPRRLGAPQCWQLARRSLSGSSGRGRSVSALAEVRAWRDKTQESTGRLLWGMIKTRMTAEKAYEPEKQRLRGKDDGTVAKTTTRDAEGSVGDLHLPPPAPPASFDWECEARRSRNTQFLWNLGHT
ncbi:hypothetical protein BKA81DRAFT_163103 [Phyllosticta paracitricarpa]